MKTRILRAHIFPVYSIFLIALSSVSAAQAQLAAEPIHITIDWNKTVIVSKSTPTLQVVVNPMLRPGALLCDPAYAAIRQLGANYVRYVPWLPYPKLAVAELYPPTKEKTSWNFSLIDPMTKNFLQATKGHSIVMNFSTIPAWLFRTDKPVKFPADPNQVDWNYTQGNALTDPSGIQLGDYYARLVSWYIKGGFIDENGKWHTSGYYYHFPIWEVLNEVEAEHYTTPEQYTVRYDAIVSAIHKVSPETKFMGLALALPSDDGPRWFEYFLNHANHKPDIPIDFISYHFYAAPTKSQTIDDWQYTFFDQADRFLTTVRYIEGIRKRLSPNTKTDTDELGVILPDETMRIPKLYWNAAGALYAYLFINLSQQGIDVIGESQLVGYPSQFPSVSMMDWLTRKPNARYWVLKLLKENFNTGDRLVSTQVDSSDIDAQAFLSSDSKKLLLVNKRNRSVTITLPQEASSARLTIVDETSGEDAARISQANGKSMILAPFSVTVAAWQ